MKRYPKSIVVVLLAAIALAACSKAKKQTTTEKMAGMRKWKGHSSGSTNPPPGVGSYSSYSNDLPDTAFALTTTSPTSITIGQKTFELEKVDAEKRIHYFGTAWEYQTYSSGTGITYFEANDSIVYGDGFFSHSMTSNYVYHTVK